MATRIQEERSALQRLAAALLDDVERIAMRSVERMQERLPGYAEVPAEALLPVTLTGTRTLLEAVLDPHADPRRSEQHFRTSGETRAAQGITAGALLQAWRIGVDSVREEAHNVAGRLRIPDDVLLEFVEATLEWGDLGMRIAAQAHREAEIGELERLAKQQAALRRVATMVAGGSSPEEIFVQVAEQVALLLGLETAGVVRYDPDGKVAIVGSYGAIREVLPVGSRLAMDGDSVSRAVYRTSRPGRISSYERGTGELAAAARRAGLRSSVASPIVVGGRLWGSIVAATTREEPLPEAAESRIAEFTELVASAIANTESRAALAASEARAHELAREQAALRRVATLVAENANAPDLFAAVAQEVSDLCGIPVVGVHRFDADRTFTMMGLAGATGHNVGDRRRVDDVRIAARILDTGRPARWHYVTAMPGTPGTAARDDLTGQVAGAPIMVDGRVWGFIAAGGNPGDHLPDHTEERLARFTELVATAIANSQAREHLAELAGEQAALRRVATTVARGAPPDQVVRQVAEEVGRLLGVELTGMYRFEPDGYATTVTSWGEMGEVIPAGRRVKLDGDSVTAKVARTAQPARIESYEGSAGQIAADMRTIGMRSGVGSPIVVNGRLWGAIAAATSRADPLPSDAEERIAEFTELVATAIANVEAQTEVQRLAEEQAALRRVATLVARGVSPDEIFSAVSDEVGRFFGAAAAINRFEDDGSAMVVVGLGQGIPVVSVGSRWELADFLASTAVYRTGRPARNEGTSHRIVSGPVPDILRQMAFVSTVAAPIVVQGHVWGVIMVSDAHASLPPETEEGLERFTELVSTAIANAESRAELGASEARAHDLAREQAALRRVATLVAEGISPDELFSAVTREVAGIIDVPMVGVHRYEGDGTFTTMGVSRETSFTVGSRWPIEEGGLAETILATGRPARKDDYSRMPGPLGAAVRRDRMLSTVGVPIVVDGSVWGFMVAAATPGNPLPDQTEERFARFIELIATAIANSQANAALKQLADEQAALRQVATLVAQGAPPSTVFEAVAAEMKQVLGADGVTLNRYEGDEEVVVLAHCASDPLAKTLPAGTRVRHPGENVTSLVRSSGRSARLEQNSGPPGAIAKLVGNLRVRASVGAPIVVDGRLWGVAVAHWSGEASPPADTEQRMTKFAELLATAIANADSRDQLMASRARLLTEADEARRRVVRDLHDGAQQRLVHTIVTLKHAQRALRANDAEAESLIAEALERAQQGNAELRELAHGILPAVLTQGGLRSGVNTIVSRLDLPVEADIPAERFPAEIEASAYFVVAEALTNVVKHSQAGRAEVRAWVEDGLLHVEVGDDGIGGANPNGHGLVGLRDRVTALGGRLDVTNPAAGGTLVSVTLPLSAG